MAERTTRDGAALLTISEVADRLRVSQRTVHRYVTDGHLAALRTPGGGLRFRDFDVEAVLTEGGSVA